MLLYCFVYVFGMQRRANKTELGNDEKQFVCRNLEAGKWTNGREGKEEKKDGIFFLICLLKNETKQGKKKKAKK